jgi:hypothetical protein
MKTRFLPILAAIGLAANANAANILITKFDFDNFRAPYTTMKATLEAAGHTATIVDARTGGSLAAALGAASYDQVYLFDLTTALYLNATDTSALSSFWSTHKGLVVDSRSYGYYFQAPILPSRRCCGMSPPISVLRVAVSGWEPTITRTGRITVTLS